MPGPVIEGHAKIEDVCDDCHKPFSKEAQDSLCLDCHKPTRADIDARRGFHGKTRQRQGVQCAHCHTDHVGRDADIVPFDRALFDHNDSDYPLTGRHRQVECSGCHVAGKRWAEAPSTCFACHEKDQPHKGNLGKECDTCHQDIGWRQVKTFDHAKTKFPLRGKHAEVACANCHLGEVYRGAGIACNDCHAIQDVHQKRFGTTCDNCHNEQNWKTSKFDHDKSTKFPLLGAHKKATCAACHGESLTSKLSMVCADCHRTQDVHQAQLGPNCGDCHDAVAWKNNVIFDHGLTSYPLIGLHAVVTCEACHATPAYQDAGTRCQDCHKSDDAHAGRFTAKCETCHSANGWNRVSFDHGKQTKYPLTGAHARTGCYNCHREKNVADASLPTNCYACHRKQDVHRGAFGRGCGECHTTTAFTPAFIRKRTNN